MAVNTRTITAADAILTLSIDQIVNTPVRIQGFAADNIFDTGDVVQAEVVQGVDGRLSAGFVYNPTPLNITLMPDSPSVDLFELWRERQQANRAVYVATGNIILNSTKRKYVLTRGFLISQPPTPTAGRVLAARRFAMMFETLTGSRTGA